MRDASSRPCARLRFLFAALTVLLVVAVGGLATAQSAQAAASKDVSADCRYDNGSTSVLVWVNKGQGPAPASVAVSIPQVPWSGPATLVNVYKWQTVWATDWLTIGDTTGYTAEITVYDKRGVLIGQTTTVCWRV